MRRGEVTTVTLRERSVDELLLDVGNGDHQALAELYDHLSGLVRANVRRALHDAARTDDVAEEVFFEVWRQAVRFDPDRTPAVLWVLDVAHRLAAEHNRYRDVQAPGRPAIGGAPPGPSASADGRASGSTPRARSPSPQRYSS